MTQRFVDLSGPVYNRMWSYNQANIGEVVVPETEIARVSSIEKHGFEMWRLGLSAHSGTYLETAAHEVPGRRTIDQVDVAELFRPAKLLRVPKKEPRSFIYPEELEANAPKIEAGDALLIDTGWGEHWSEPNYIQDTPCYHPSCLDWLMAQPMALWGVDTPVAQADGLFDRGIDWKPGEGDIIIPLFREKDILLLAPLVNLDQVQGDSGRLVVLPLKILGVCATPCRAVFIEGP